MNIDIDYIIIESSESPAEPAPTAGFVSRNRLMVSLIGAAVASGVALTSCLAIKGHTASIPSPQSALDFRIVERLVPSQTDGKPAHRQTAPVRTARNTNSGVGTQMQLTFDDGPHPTYTPQILAWLKANHLHATFFVVGENAARYPALVKRIVSEGHQIGNHSWNHPKLTVMSDTKVRDQLQRTHDAIVKACGTAPKVFRPPYGALSPRQRVWIESEFGYTTVLWDIDTLDWKNSSAEVAQIIDRDLRPGGRNIILAHDIHSKILPALESLKARIAVPSQESPASGESE